MTTQIATTGTTRSADGTTIGFTSVGTGPDLVIVHGSMQAGASQTDLAALLADRFRVHLMDRRGRGESGAYPADLTSTPDAATALEVADLRAVLTATGAHRVLGISSGAIIAARTSLVDPRIERLALFEPPISVDGSMHLELIPRMATARAAGDTSTYLGLAMKVSEMGPPWMFGLPTPILAAASGRMLRQPRTQVLATALPVDIQVAFENADRAGEFAGVTAATLVISGTKTRPYLRAASAAVAAAIPGSARVELPGQSHGVTQNRSDWGKPEQIAPALATFFA